MKYSHESFCEFAEVYIFASRLGGNVHRMYAGVAQLVERHLAKVEVAGSSLVSRSELEKSGFNALKYGFTLRSIKFKGDHIALIYLRMPWWWNW